MKIVLFCENKYAVDILYPLYQQAVLEGEQVLWYVHKEKIPEFPLRAEVEYTNSIQETYNFSPDVIYVPGNIVPYYLPGVKVQVFHGYAAEKKDHFIIRRYFDLYLTQGPYFTKKFVELSKAYKDFDVVETGWTKQDWIKKHLHDFDEEKAALLTKHQRDKLVLYAPTFSPSLTSLPHIKEALIKLVREKNILLLLKFHPLTKSEWIEEYKSLAAQEENIIWVDDFNVTKYQLMADVMISDTSSTVYEFLLLNKPVITYRTIAKDIYWTDIKDLSELPEAFELVQTDKDSIAKRQWIVENYDPYLDGNVCKRMLEAARAYIRHNGVPPKRKLNLWRQYTSIKKFGRIKR
ncbi:CDP-glycerol glycerophosphotransferase family protein [Bacteroides sp. 224]|uniref:CDP-glycerol glycerophosphotransferase family protein n=1 Tax=Bacteroides sp. 224 TaxID=2302936 RepID=UPI0013D8B935|nr:CDP-glycerol glycerophosphotransferase family protein [Bacteroides sp. 224]NDV64292.1 CDP-glycerol glycerophosphotransferase [Bacteroides sp. 224]